ncbi:MAG: hypothetical protein KDA28_05145 [Phycisphaerales bacterium]|nr:hypothetical protein [Phycisphaerales bacterium]
MTRLTCIALAALSGSAMADNWLIDITVDNYYDIYYGNNLGTTFYAGGDGNWATVETYNTTRPATDYVYVSTASDHSVAQGFLGEFRNLTQGTLVKTGDAAWEVFNAGKFLQAINPSWPSVWPASLQPTQSEVDQAISFAETNALWIPTSFDAAWTNASHPGPWGNNLPGIAGSATWIWHDSGGVSGSFYTDPYGGYNHEEFLVFRLRGDSVPAPGAMAVLGAMGLRRRRR